MKKIFFIDIDGTIMDNNSFVSESTIFALQKLNHDHDIFLCTARNYNDIDSYLKKLTDGLICGNGSLITYASKIIKEDVVNETAARSLIDYFRQHQLEFYLECQDGNYCTKGYKNAAIDKYRQYLTYKGFDVSEADTHYNNLTETDIFNLQHVYRVNYLMNKSQQFTEISQKFSDLDHVRWGSQEKLFGEITSKGINKGDSAIFCRNYLNAEIETSIGIGDSNIDIPLFENVGLAVAMGNASDNVKKYADIITSSVNEDGVVKFLKDNSYI